MFMQRKTVLQKKRRKKTVVDVMKKKKGTCLWNNNFVISFSAYDGESRWLLTHNEVRKIVSRD